MTSPAYAYTDLTVSEAQELISTDPDLIILDVREYYEYCGKTGHIPEALNYPNASNFLEEKYTDFTSSDSILILCQSGKRSEPAADFLDSKGFTSVYNMIGGMSAWDGETELCNSACPAEILLKNDENKLRTLRRFRDEVLANSPAGRNFTVSYYRSEKTINTFLKSNPRLKVPAARILKQIMPLIELLIEQTKKL